MLLTVQEAASLIAFFDTRFQRSESLIPPCSMDSVRARERGIEAKTRLAREYDSTQFMNLRFLSRLSPHSTAPAVREEKSK